MIQVLSEIRDILLRIAEPRPLTSLILPIITSTFSMVALFFSALAALAASRSSHYSKESLRNAMLMSMSTSRYSKDTFETRIALRQYFTSFDGNADKMMAAFKELRESNPGSKMDGQRRDFITYFLKLHDLRLHGLLNDDDMHNYVNESDLEMLLHISRPLEVVVYNTIPGTHEISLKTPYIMFDYFQIFFDYFERRTRVRNSNLPDREKKKEFDRNKKQFKTELKKYWKNRKTLYVYD